MKKILRRSVFYLLLAATFLISINLTACAKKEEEKTEKTKERIKNTYTDYVDKGRETMKDANDLNKDISEQIKKKEKEMFENEK